MSQLLDILSPDTIGEDMIAITVDPASLPLRTQRTIALQFDYSKCLPSGVVKPLTLEVQPWFNTGEGYQRVEFDRFLPEGYAITVSAAGQYLVLLKEQGHNFWQGRLVLDVGGDPYVEPPRSARALSDVEITDPTEP